MKNYGSKIKYLLCAVLSLALLASTAVFAASGVLVTVESAVMQPGGRTEVAVYVKNSPGVSGAAFTVLCPDEGVRLVDIKPESPGSFSKKLEKGNFSWLKGTNITGDFKLVTLVFEAAADASGDYEISLALKGGLEGNLTNAAMEIVSVEFDEATLTVTGCDEGEDCPTAGFSDLKKGAWYHEAVDFVVNRGIMRGVDGESFAPNLSTSRATVVTVLYRLSGESAEVNASFSDVKPGLWYSDAVAWAAENGIVEGYGDGRFGPNHAVTREQLAVIFHRFAEHMGLDTSYGGSLSDFVDEDEISPWAEEAAEWAVGIGLMEGRGNNTFVPGGESSRSELAMLLLRWCKISE